MLELACSESPISKEAKESYIELVERINDLELYKKANEFIKQNEKYLKHA